MPLTFAITHIQLDAANAGKLAQLDALADEYIRVCQQYVTAFCTSHEPRKFAAPWLDSPLSQRWQRVVIQHAAGQAQAWRTNRDRAYAAYHEARDEYVQQVRDETLPPGRQEPAWTEWRTPVLKQSVLRPNANVAALEPSTDSTFDYWLRISTLDKGAPIRIPVKLAAYHRQRLAGRTPNTSMTLTRKSSGWWLTLTVDAPAPSTTAPTAPVVGVDVGIANFLTTSTRKRYGTFHRKLAHRFQRDREKRRRKAKLRACLKKKGVQRLPSLANPRLGRHVRQTLNRAINQFFTDHPGYQVAYEDLSVRTMRFKARRMNAYLSASNLGHLPKQLAWGARKRGQRARAGHAAYSSQECSRCHLVAVANRPDQRTFRCQACGFTCHADENAAINHAARFDDHELRACKSKEAVKALIDARHACFCQSHESLDTRSVSTRRDTHEGPSGVGQHFHSHGRKHLRPAS